MEYLDLDLVVVWLTKCVISDICITARVLICGMCRAQVFYVEIYQRARIPKFKKQKSKYLILNIDSVCGGTQIASLMARLFKNITDI